MSEPIEILISKFVEGTLTPEERLTFDKRFESDASFSSKALMALSGKLGPGPDAFLERMGKAAKPAVEEAWRQRLGPGAQSTAGRGFSFGSLLAFPWASVASSVLSAIVPVAILIAGLWGFVLVAKNLVKCGIEQETNSITGETVTISSAELSKTFTSSVVSKRGFSTTTAQPKTSAVRSSAGKKLQEGRRVRFENLPVSSLASIEVLDAQGVCVKHLYQGAWAQGQRLDWDGLDDQGKPVKVGDYQACVKNKQGTFISRFSVR